MLFNSFVVSSYVAFLCWYMQYLDPKLMSLAKCPCITKDVCCHQQPATWATTSALPSCPAPKRLVTISKPLRNHLATELSLSCPSWCLKYLLLLASLAASNSHHGQGPESPVGSRPQASGLRPQVELLLCQLANCPGTSFFNLVPIAKNLKEILWSFWHLYGFLP